MRRNPNKGYLFKGLQSNFPVPYILVKGLTTILNGMTGVLSKI